MMVVEKVSAREGFVALEPVWNALLQQSASDTLALTYQWLLTWWDIFGEGRELHILVVHDAGAVIGIAPLLKRRILHFGLPFQRLEFLATGENEADEICSHYLDFILRCGRETEALQAIFDFLRADSDWDELLLKELRASSPTVSLLEKLGLAQELKCDFTPDGESVFLPLTEDWEPLLTSFDRRSRSHTRQDLALWQQSDCTLEMFDTPTNIGVGLKSLMELHQQLWISRGKPGVFASDKFTRFHRAVLVKISPQKQARFFILRCGEKPVAGVYLFLYKGTVFYYQSGYLCDGFFHSPGTLIRNLAMQQAIEDHSTEWDFMRAEPGSYKYRWSKKTRALVQIRMAKPHLKETVLASSSRVVDGLRHVKRALHR